VLVDESQFLSQGAGVAADRSGRCLDIPVLAYGLRTDFRGELFEGSQYLLAWADEPQRDQDHLPHRAQGDDGGARG
jgi:thymidine kinase